MDKITFNFENRTAVITGGAQGFGFDIARRFLSSGAKVIIWDNDPDTLKRSVKELNNTNLTSNVIDVSKFEEVKNCTNEIVKNSKIDILINNAGITGPTAPLWEYDLEKWKKVVDINLMGTFNCCRAIVPNMIKNNYGRIVNVASVAGKDGNANASAYSAGKAGAIGLTKSLGKELADKNIAVNAVTPAGAKTRILDQMTKEHVQRMLSKVPRGRFLEVEEFTSLVCWLSSEENTFSTAAVEKVFSSDESQQIKDVNSSTSKNLPLGTLESILCTCSLLIWFKMRVFAPAGVTAFTAIFLSASSFPNDFVSPIAPAFPALYALALAFPSFPATDATLTILP